MDNVSNELKIGHEKVSKKEFILVTGYWTMSNANIFCHRWMMKVENVVLVQINMNSLESRT